MAEDLLEKGAIVQRDKETYAIAPHIPGGIITDFNLLRRLADVAEKYGVKAMKLTSAQRVALVGLKSKTWIRCGRTWEWCPEPPSACVCAPSRSAPAPPSAASPSRTRWGGAPSRRKVSRHAPALKFKIGVSGCPNNCSEFGHQGLRPGGRGQGLAGAGRRVRLGPQTPPGGPHRHRPDRCRGPRPGRAGAGLVQAG